MYGCDGYTGFDNHTSFGSITNIVVNLLIIFVSYAIVARRLTLDQRGKINSPVSQAVNNMFTNHLKMLFSLSVAYTICLIPASVFSWGMFDNLLAENIDQKNLKTIQAISSCLYWSMYGMFFKSYTKYLTLFSFWFPGLNFVLYLTTSERIRAAYLIFLKDVFRKTRKNENVDSIAWWLALRNLSLPEENQKKITNLGNHETLRGTSSININIESGTVSFK